MKLRWYRLLPVFLAALWLPLQAVAAVSMLYCDSGAPMSIDMAQGEDGDCPMHAAHSGDAPSHSPAGCQHCLACAAGPVFVPAALMSGIAMPHAVVYAAWQPTPPTDHIATPPHHPPKQSA